ncbi:MAG: hypothetical protein KAR18_13280, partial [Spirochaetes bacterium]|nr:hypothetical protein [Spirochaetota bacterium]
ILLRKFSRGIRSKPGILSSSYSSGNKVFSIIFRDIASYRIIAVLLSFPLAQTGLCYMVIKYLNDDCTGDRAEFIILKRQKKPRAINIYIKISIGEIIQKSWKSTW